MRALIAFIVSIALAGCATCREHPVACGVGSVLVAGAVAGSIVATRHSDSQHQHQPGPPWPVMGVQ
jgi:hypothetical protein